MSAYHFKCERDHIIALEIADSKYNRFIKLAESGHRVCPICRTQDEPVNSKIVPFDEEQQEQWYDRTCEFSCKHGHITEFYPFTNGMINISWTLENGEEVYENIQATPHQLKDMLDKKELFCRHNIISEKSGKKRVCRCKMKSVSGLSLELPRSTIGIKTKVRVGDVWDKARCPEPVRGNYERAKGGMIYKETEFERRAGRRIKDMRKGRMEVYDDQSGQQVSVQRQRQTKKVGETITAPTKRKGRRVSKESLKDDMI
jgi:hypothetical protein